MAQAFTPEQCRAIRGRLFDSACRHAIGTGFKKTSLDALTADAGISKSSFYKFYESKEQLFLEVAAHWEAECLARGMQALERSAGKSDKERAAALVLATFEAICQLGIMRFLREDLPQLHACFSEALSRRHCLNSASYLFDQLCEAHIRFTAPESTVRSVIQLMYLSILNIGDIGESFFPALRELVQSACDRLVA